MQKRYGRAIATLYVATMVLSSTASSFAQSRGNNWRTFLSIRHSEEFDRVRNEESFPERISSGADAGVTFMTRTQRSNFGFDGRVGTTVYDDPRFEDQLNYGGSFSWNYRASSRSNMNLSQSFNRNLRLDTLAEIGLVPNDFRSTGYNTKWGFQRQSGRSTSWSVGLDYQYTELTNQVPIAPSQIALNEQPFGNDVSIPLIDTGAPTEVVLPNGEEEILRILATEGLSDSSAEQHYGNASFALNHGFSPRTTFGFNVIGGYRAIETTFARDGSVGAAQVFIQQALGGANALSASYSVQRSFATDPSTTTHTVFGGWSLSPDDSTIRANVFGGASRFEAENVTSSTQPVVNAAISANFTSSSTARASYRRQFSTAQGFGRSQLLDFANAGITQSFGDRVDASATASASFSSDPVEEAREFDTRRVGGTVTVRIVGGLRFGTSYNYVENEQRFDGQTIEETLDNWSAYLTFSADF